MSNEGIAKPGEPRVAILVPCFNEGTTVQKVVEDFRRELPAATVWVFDNNSTDGTADRARAAGAVVRREKRQGKGQVVAAMLEQVDADFFVLVDGDDTYPAKSVHELLAPVIAGDADMVVGQRLSSYDEQSFRPLHIFGNKLVGALINAIFGSSLVDIMSGYRAFNRDVADSLPVVAWGFDIETEMTLQLLYRRYVIRELPIEYGARPSGSESKLRTFRDGARVLLRIFGILKAYKPLTFFGSLALGFFALALLVGAFPIYEYATTRYVESVPKAILAAGLMVLGFLSASVGVTLHTVNYRILEMGSVLGKQIRRRR